MISWKSSFLLAFFIVMVVPCIGGTMKETTMIRGLDSIPSTAWESLAKKNICFGHQSVGANILEGMKDVLRDNPQIRLSIRESTVVAVKGYGAFNHFQVGSNMNPGTKIASFASFMGQGGCKDTDIAFFKFCYVDITPASDPEAIFENYRRSLAQLSTKYPKTTFVHVTVPLTRLQTGPKALIKKMIGKPVSGREDNIIRNRYNALLLKEYGGKAPIFDLARIEATHSDGKMELFEKNGSKFLALVPGYTYDDGHLNETGRRVVATELLCFLALLDVKTGH